MSTSEARILANQKNALRSTGPKTVEGKERSRRNGLKHGLSGAGVVLLDEDADEVVVRNEELQAELAPQSVMGKLLVRQLATFSIKMERSSRQESAAIAVRVRHAAEDFDQARLDEADHLLDVLGEDPRIHLRKLGLTPEGVDCLIVAWQELRDALTRDPKPIWTAWHRERFENLTGLRIDDAVGSRINSLSRAIWGDFSALGDDEGMGLREEPRRAWAREQVVELIDARLAALEEQYESFDFAMIDLDRSQAGDRALFDPSRSATLARRYESEASRNFYKALKELRRVEAEAAARPPASPKSPLPAGSPPLASSRERPGSTLRVPQPIPSFGYPTSDRVLSGSMGSSSEGFGGVSRSPSRA